MLAYRVYRDVLFLVETDINTFSYVDNDTEHDVEYCYTVKQFMMMVNLLIQMYHVMNGF